MVRAFISVDFSEKKIHEKIKEIQDQLLLTNAHLRMVNPAILHITLEFLGEITEEQLSVIKDIMNSLDFSKISLNVENPNVLPNENYVRVVYCEIKGDEEKLIKMQKDLRGKLKINGFRVDDRKFRPHLTIARVKSAKNKSELVRVIKELKETTCGTQEIVSVKLKESVLKPEGPQYSIIHEVYASDYKVGE